VAAGNHAIPLALSICAHAAAAISKPTMNATIVFISQIKTTTLLGVKFNGRTIWIADAHRGNRKRFVVQTDENLTAFRKLKSTIRADNPVDQNESAHRPEHWAAVSGGDSV
jgi:hypothetical protein